MHLWTLVDAEDVWISHLNSSRHLGDVHIDPLDLVMFEMNLVYM